MTSSARRTSMRLSEVLDVSKRVISSRSVDQLLEPLDVGHQQVEGLLRPLGQVVAVVLQHLDRVGERGQRRAQLVAHRGREAWRRARSGPAGRSAMSLNDWASGARSGSSVASSRVPSLPPARRLGRLAHVGERPHHPPRHPPAERRARQRGRQRGADQRDAERVERALQLVQRRDLEVRGVGRRQRHAHGQVGLAPVAVAHAGRLAPVDHRRAARSGRASSP